MMTRRPLAWRARLAWGARLTTAALLLTLVGPEGTLGQGVNVRINNPASDTSVENGTHITQGIPAVTVYDVTNPASPRLLAVYSDTAGFKKEASGLGVSTSVNGGKTWTDLGQIPGGGRTVTGTPTVAYDAKRQQILTIATTCEEVTKTCQIESLAWPLVDTRWTPTAQVTDPSPVGVTVRFSSHGVAVDNNPASETFGTAYATWSEFR